MKKIINITILILCLIILINNNINIVKAKYNSDYSTENHIHDYSYSYSSVNNLCHNGYCFCGELLLESHNFIKYGTGFKCRGCGYFTKGPIISEYILR